MKAKDVMTAGPECVEYDQSVREAAEKMYELDVRHLPVLKQGEVVGMISDRDLHGQWFQSGLYLSSEEDSEKAVSEIMSGALVSVVPDAELKEVVELMLQNKISAVLVIDEEQSELNGIISYVDILEAVGDFL